MGNRAEIYVRNASAMWSSLDPGHRERSWTRIEHPGTTRLILSAPTDLSGLSELSPTRTVRIEDVFDERAEPQPFAPGADLRRMPVMNRPPGDLPRSGNVIEVRDEDTLAAAEHVIVDGFPLPQHQPRVRGTALPPRVLSLPGWRVWLAYDDGVPGAAAFTYDDGEASGVYWLATLPEHRSKGLGRAVLSTAIAARPDHEFTLVATEAGRPLYESMGFATVVTTTWHLRRPLAPQQARGQR